VDLLPSEEQDAIGATVAAYLRDRLPLDGRGSSFVDAGSGIDSELWSACCGLGWLALGLPEAAGGVGYGIAEEVMLFRELGRSVAPGPFLPGVLGAHLAAAAADQELVARIVDGSTMVALATPIGTAEIGESVTGELSVVHTTGAELVLVCDAGGAALVNVDDLEIEGIDPIDGAVPTGRGRSRGASSCVFLPSDDPALGGASIHARGLVLAAATAAGVADGATRAIVEYAKVRVQFGRPIGTFQAIKHRCADMAVAAEAAFAQTCFAAVALRDGAADAELEAVIAKYYADAAAHSASDGAVHMHGAIGFTSLTVPHRYVYRANLLRTVLAHRAQLLDRIIGRDPRRSDHGR
jgi:alkylation response protein AidB-like acyl-CoA dehydrogenase